MNPITPQDVRLQAIIEELQDIHRTLKMSNEALLDELRAIRAQIARTPPPVKQLIETERARKK